MGNAITPTHSRKHNLAPVVKSKNRI